PHGDPESCGAHREVRVEALTGAHAGKVLSREMPIRGCRCRSFGQKAIRPGATSRAPVRPSAVVDVYGRFDVVVDSNIVLVGILVDPRPRRSRTTPAAE